MNYSKTVWKDGVYQYPNRYVFEDNLDGTYNITRSLGTVTQLQTEVVADLMNNMETGIAQSNESSMYQTVTGTPNAMLCELSEDVLQGKIVRFLAIGNNNGTVTTLNGIPIYRVNSTTPPTIKTGEQIILCYNQSNNCWLYQHSAEGNATTNQVLSGYTFSTSNGLSLVGTMPTISTKEIFLTAINQTYSIQSGYYDTGSYVKAPTYQNLAGSATVNNSNQILSGYRGLNGNGLVNGTLSMNDYFSIGVAITDANSSIHIPNITKDIKLAIMIYNGEGRYTSTYGYDYKRISIYDPDNLFTGAVHRMLNRTDIPDSYNTVTMSGSQKNGSSPSTKWGDTNIAFNDKSTFENGLLSLSFYSSSAVNVTVQYIIFYK